MAIKLVNRLSKELGRTLNVSVLFKQNTIEKLARYLEKNSESSTHIELVKVNRAEEQLLSFAQERLWFIERYKGGRMLWPYSTDIQVVRDSPGGTYRKKHFEPCRST